MVCMVLRMSPRLPWQNTRLRDTFRRTNPATRKSRSIAFLQYIRRASSILINSRLAYLSKVWLPGALGHWGGKLLLMSAPVAPAASRYLGALASFSGGRPVWWSFGLVEKGSWGVHCTQLPLPRHEVWDVSHEEGLSSVVGQWNWSKQPLCCCGHCLNFLRPLDVGYGVVMLSGPSVAGLKQESSSLECRFRSSKPCFPDFRSVMSTLIDRLSGARRLPLPLNRQA